MMKICFFITSLGGGGAERVVCNLSNYLTSHQHEITIVVLRGKDATYELSSSVVVEYLQPSYYSDSKPRLYRWKEFLTVYNFLRGISSDVLLVPFLELPVTYSLLLKPFYQRKLVICERNNPLFYPLSYQIVFKLFSHKSDGVVCQTKVICDWYKPHVGRKTKLVVIPNSINMDILKTSMVKERKKVIMTMGRLEPQKNHMLLISAFSELADKYPNWNVYIYGKGPLEKELKGSVTSMGLEERVFLLGFTKDVVSAYNSAGIFVLTSDHEGMPNVLAEAMAMGLPCISTDCGGGGAKELIQDGINGLLIPINDKKALIKELRYFMDDEQYSSQIGIQAAKVRNVLSPDKIHHHWEEYFESIYNRLI